MNKKINRDSLKITMLYRFPLYNRGFPIILFWSQKSGCTILAKWFFFQLGLLDQALQYNPWVHYYREQVYEKQKDHQKNLIQDLIQGKKTIKLVRNPYHRAVSSFLGLARMSFLGKARRRKEWEKIKKTLYNIKKYDDREFQESINFKQYLYYLKNTGTKVVLINAHRGQQYICNEETYVSNYIYLENFVNSIHNIEKKYELLESPETVFESQHHCSHLMKNTENYTEALISKKLLTRKSFPSYDSFYDQETTELVNELFKEDFKMYGYEKSLV